MKGTIIASEKRQGKDEYILATIEQVFEGEPMRDNYFCFDKKLFDQLIVGTYADFGVETREREGKKYVHIVSITSLVEPQKPTNAEAPLNKASAVGGVNKPSREDSMIYQKCMDCAASILGNQNLDGLDMVEIASLLHNLAEAIFSEGKRRGRI